MELFCKECGSKYIVNKKYCLCNYCNHKRLHKDDVEEEKKDESCSKCSKYQIVNKKYKLCEYCNIERIHKIPYKDYVQQKINRQLTLDKEKIKTNGRLKEIKQSSEKGDQNKVRDAKFFRQIWEDRRHFSEVSGKFLGDQYSAVFCSHILTKGAYPRFRHLEENIKLVTHEEHDLWEFGDRDKLREDPKWDWIFEREEELKRLYYNKIKS